MVEEQGVNPEVFLERLTGACNVVYEHECAIIDRLFSKGTIKGITADQMKYFVQARLDLCMNQLGFDKVYNPKYDPISAWFYKNINSGQLHDFFHKQGNNYNRDWKEGAFVW